MSARALSGLLICSLVANAVLAVTLVLVWEPARPLEVTLVRPPAVTNVYSPIRTNIVMEVRPLRWEDLESTNFFIYIANLRSIGCPEPTIRDIIVAEVEELFARRRAREILRPAHQWWRYRPDPEVAEEATRQSEALAAEQRELLVRLLGEPASIPASPASSVAGSTSLDGPILGDLSDDLREQVHQIEARHRERVRGLAYSDPDTPPTPPTQADIARLEAGLRAELAAILAPDQLEEYLLRHSRTADQLRRQTRDFEPSPAEFRALFQATDPIQQQLAALGGDTSESAEVQRAELLVLQEAAIQEALGLPRYAEYHLLQDSDYLAVRARIERLDLPLDHALPLYEIDQVTREERGRLMNDASLSAEELTEQLAQIEIQRLQALRQILGPDGFRRFQGPPEP